MRQRRTGESTAAAVPSRQDQRAMALLGLCLAALILNIEVMVVNVALPTLVSDLGANTTDLQWVVDAYTLVFASLILAAGTVSDRFGRKGLLLGGLAVFAAASLAGAFAQSPSQLIVARAVMGLGAAAVFPSTLSLLANIFTGRKERALALGLWGAMTGVGVATGPIVGGWLLDYFWWGSVFVFMAPVALLVAVLVAVGVPTSRDPGAPSLDWPGIAVSTAAMGALVVGLIQAPVWGWSSRLSLAAFVLATALAVLFVTVERRQAQPMLDVRLFSDRRFSAASGAITISFFSLTGFMFIITQYLQFVRGYSPLETGVRQLPVALSVAVAAVLGTRLAVSIGNRVVVSAGLLLFSASLLWIAQTAPDGRTVSYTVIAMQMVVGGAGFGLLSAPATEAIMGAVPLAKAGVGSAVNDATRLAGATLGVAVIGSIAASLYRDRLEPVLSAALSPEAQEAANGSLGGALHTAGLLDRAGLAQASAQLVTSAVDAFLHAMQVSLLSAAVVAFAGALLAAVFLPSQPGLPEAHQSADEPAALRPS